MPHEKIILLTSPCAHARLERAAAWLAARAPAEETLVLAASTDAANELVRGLARERKAAFGWHRQTLPRLAATLAAPALVENDRVAVGLLASEAVVARALDRLRSEGALGRYERVADGPGFARAVRLLLAELRLESVAADEVGRVDADLGRIARAYEREMEDAGLADRAIVFEQAIEVARDRKLRHPLLDLPTLSLDVPVSSERERRLLEAVLSRARGAFVTAPSGDDRTITGLRAFEGMDVRHVAAGDRGSLARLQQHLFEEGAPEVIPADEGVVVFSAPGESRECVEIARHMLRLADEGIPFDHMAVLLRSPAEYRAHLEEALSRARIPAHFARGTIRPDPAGRAFLALLNCAAEGLSARRFAEYLSLGEVPDAGPSGTPPQAPPAAERWTAPDEDLLPERVAEALGATAVGPDERAQGGDSRDPVQAGTLRAPRHWERLLVDAAVIGGRDRWERRLAGLARERQLELEELDDPDDPAADRIRRDVQQLAGLRRYAMPLIDALAALPERALWDEWLERLGDLAARSLRQSDRVLSVLAELAPMGAVGPVDLGEVRLVLTRRLLDVTVPPAASRGGCVWISPVEAARGMSFEVVFCPGLAERLFPRKIAEEPILLDEVRRRLGRNLVTNEDRIAAERLALRLVVGAASRSVLLSYPRLDLDQARPRVPSFYALEALRAAEGQLPGFQELAKRAETTTAARVGWPAPEDPREAIDEAEHDLALLARLLKLEPEESVGTARYLLGANPHLARALRFRARRWLRRWTPADGLVEPGAAAMEALAAHALSARSYSPTALQNYAACPYRFFLYAVHRLAPREQPAAIEEMDPLQRGSFVHDVQFELFARLRDAALLPVRPSNLARASELLDDVLDEIRERYHDLLAPAIERVWADEVSAIRADLREWLERAGADASGFVPWRFELAFGLPDRRARDPDSRIDPVELDCGIRLRGSIDLVERRQDGVLRVTDHKTGKVRLAEGQVVAGGEALQPVFYALVAEKMFPDHAVAGGRLYYCTATGAFEERSVALDDEARQAADGVAEVIGRALSEGFLPAAPARGACEWCDYQSVCGPHEEFRTSRKPSAELKPLERLRGLR